MQISDAFKKFYAQLYTSKSQVDYDMIFNFLNPINIPRLLSDISKRLEESISQAEIASAIFSMQFNKCPGSDSIPQNFLRIFFLCFLHCYAKSFQNLLDIFYHLPRLSSPLLPKKIRTRLSFPLTGLSPS